MSDSNITQKDIAVIMGLILSVVFISITLPMAGLGSEEELHPDDIPSLEADTDRFDFAGDFPRSGSAPGEGTKVLEYDRPFEDYAVDIARDDGAFGFALNIDYITESNLIGEESPIPICVLTDATTTPPEPDPNSPCPDGDEIEQANLLPGDIEHISSDTQDYSIRFEYSEFNEYPDDSVEAVIEWELTEEPDDDGLLSRIPFIGGALDSTVGMIGFVGSIIAWFVGTLFTITFNIFWISGQAAVFGVSLIGFVTTNYGMVVSSAPTTAALVLGFIPVLLGIQLFRVTMIFVNAFWFG